MNESARKKSEQRLGPFVLLDEMSSSGPARRFRARYRPTRGDPPLALDEDAVVVVKVLRDAGIRDQKVSNAFAREAELLQMIDHPSVVRGITRGFAGGRVWTATEYVEGEELATLLQVARQEQLRLRPEVALVVALDALAGIAAAQALLDPRGRPLGLVHRALSPSHLVIDARGATRVQDFGDALLSVREEPDGATVVGAPGYMAPEQARGEQLTQAVDVYAIGCMLFEMLCGRAAFDVDNATDNAVREMHANNQRAGWPRTLDLPIDVRQLVDQATADAPEERPNDAAAFFALVEGLLDDPEDARARLAVVARDLVLSNPDRPTPLFVS